MEAACSSETLISEHMILTHYHIPEASTAGSISTDSFLTTWRLL
jgi:hypothetical protein